MDKILKTITLRDTGVALLDLAMPRRCIVCGAELGLRERHVCMGCFADVPLTYFWTLSHNPMADRFNELIQRDLGDAFEPYSHAAALFYYNSESSYKRIPQNLKYSRGVASGRYFAAWLGRLLASSPQFADVDLVIPVPLHWTRLARRGYNQAGVIARELAASLGAGFSPRALRRRRRTRTQTRLSGEAKARNVSGAFAAQALPKAPPRHILLVDDTFTTGATLNACRQALRAALPPSVRISVATLAYVGG